MRKNVCTRIKGFILRRTDCVLSKSFFSNLEKFFFMSHIYPTTLINIPEYLPFPKIRINTHTHTQAFARQFIIKYLVYNGLHGIIIRGYPCFPVKIPIKVYHLKCRHCSGWDFLWSGAIWFPHFTCPDITGFLVFTPTV